MRTAHLQSLDSHHTQPESPLVPVGFRPTEVGLSVTPSYTSPPSLPSLSPHSCWRTRMLGWEVPGVSSASADKAIQRVISTSQIHLFSPPCREAHAFLSGELGLPEEQRKMAGTLKDAKGRSLLPAPGSTKVVGLAGRGRMLSLLHAGISFLSTSLLSLAMCRPRGLPKCCCC